MLILVLLIFALNNLVVYSQSVQWSTFSTGGNVSTVSTTQLVSTIGEQFVGLSQNANTVIESGFLVHGAFGTTNIDEEKQLPQKFSLSQNYPNPFNPTTTIKFELPKQSLVKLELFNVLGQCVAILVDEIRPAGHYSEQFNASNITSGVYFYRLQAEAFKETRKLILLR